MTWIFITTSHGVAAIRAADSAAFRSTIPRRTLTRVPLARRPRRRALRRRALHGGALAVTRRRGSRSGGPRLAVFSGACGSGAALSTIAGFLARRASAASCVGSPAGAEVIAQEPGDDRLGVGRA